LSNPAGRNVSEARAGLESDNADADPPAIWGRLHERGSNRHAHPFAAFGRRPLVYVAPMSLAGIRNPQQEATSNEPVVRKEKAARRLLFNSNPMILDQAAINAGFVVRR